MKQLFLLFLLFFVTQAVRVGFDRLKYRFNHGLLNVTAGVEGENKILNIEANLKTPIDHPYVS